MKKNSSTFQNPFFLDTKEVEELGAVFISELKVHLRGLFPEKKVHDLCNEETKLQLNDFFKSGEIGFITKEKTSDIAKAFIDLTTPQLCTGEEIIIEHIKKIEKIGADLKNIQEDLYTKIPSDNTKGLRLKGVLANSILSISATDNFLKVLQISELGNRKDQIFGENAHRLLELYLNLISSEGRYIYSHEDFSYIKLKKHETPHNLKYISDFIFYILTVLEFKTSSKDSIRKIISNQKTENDKFLRDCEEQSSLMLPQQSPKHGKFYNLNLGAIRIEINTLDLEELSISLTCDTGLEFAQVYLKSISPLHEPEQSLYRGKIERKYQRTKLMQKLKALSESPWIQVTSEENQVLMIYISTKQLLNFKRDLENFFEKNSK